MTTDFTRFWEFFHLYRNQMGYGLLAATVNALVHWKHRDDARDSFVDVLFCGAIGWSMDSLLLQWGMPSGAAVAASAMIGYCGAQIISDWLKDKLGFGK